MTTRVFVPRDAAARSVGADDVALAIAAEAHAHGLDVTIVRNGSRGMVWLEPLVEVETDVGRVGFGHVAPEEIGGLLDAGMLEGRGPRRLGLIENIPYFAKQQRLTFARCGVVDPLSLDDYLAHGGYLGLTRALGMTGDEVVTEVTESGLRGRGGAGFPHRHQVAHGPQRVRGSEVHRLQRRRGRQRHLR